jgi:hypothetical protein
MKTIARIPIILLAALALASCQGPFGFSIEPVWVGGPPIYGIGGCYRPQYRPPYYRPQRYYRPGGNCGPYRRPPPCRYY